MKIYILVFEEVIDFVTYHTKPFAFDKEATAQSAFADVKQGMRDEYEEEIKDGWIVEEGKNYFEIYDENYSKNHYRVDLYEVDL